MEYLCAVYCLFQGEGTEGIGEREILVATLNYVTGSSIIGQNHISFTNGTTGFVNQSRYQLRAILPQPEGEPGSEWTVEVVPCPAARGKFDFLPAVRALNGIHCL